MKIFKNRAVAVLLCVLIVIASTLLSTNVKLGREADGVSDGFYKGVTYYGYKHPRHLGSTQQYLRRSGRSGLCRRLLRC